MLINMVLPGAVEVVPPDENTLLLLHGEDLTDSSIYKSIITNNNVTVSTAQSKFGGSSLYFNGSSRLEITPYNFGANDFTFDWWEYATASNVGTRFTTALSTAASGMMVFCHESNVLKIYATSSAIAANNWDILSEKTAGANIVNTWVHRAVVRSGSNILIFKNGTLEYTYNVGSSAIGYNASYPFAIGAYSTAHTGLTYNFKGYIDEFRVSNVARWTANFTPSTEPYDPGGSNGDSGGTDGDFSFTYSGNYTDNRDADGKGTVRLNTSGTLTVTSGKATVSVYILGAGGGGVYNTSAGIINGRKGGGGGGYQTVTVELTPGTYEIVIGTGGKAAQGYTDPIRAGNGGNTTAFGYTSTGAIGAYCYTDGSGSVGVGGTPNGNNGSGATGGSPNGGLAPDGTTPTTTHHGGDGYVELTFI